MYYWGRTRNRREASGGARKLGSGESRGSMENLREYLEERRTNLEKKLKNEQESLRRVSREMECTRACLAEVEGILALDKALDKEPAGQYYVVQTSFSGYAGEWGPWEDTAFIFKTLDETEQKANEITSPVLKARARLRTTE